MFVVSGKVGLVTGGSQGIGEAIVKELLKAGLRGVAIVSRNEEKAMRVVNALNKEFGKGKAIFIQCDVSDREQFENAFKKTVEVFNNIDIVVNNAITSNPNNWEEAINVNLTGTITGTILAFENYLPKHATDKESVILNIGSTAGLIGFPGHPTYSASKAGIIALSLSLGCDYHYARTKVKVVVLCPGYTDTPAVHNTEETFLGPSYYLYCQRSVEGVVPQPAAVPGEAAVKAIREGGNGSIWISEMNKKPYEIELVIKERKK